MPLKKTACLASLLLSVPLAAPTLSVADQYKYDPHPDINIITGTATSSGTSKDDPYPGNPEADTYELIYIGHAKFGGITEGRAEANYNKGILGSRVTATKFIYGGSATGDNSSCKNIALEAKGNTIIMENGSSLAAGSFLPAIYGGYTLSNIIRTGTADASENTVTIKKGASLTTDGSYPVEIYGGYAKLNRANVTSSAAATGNLVTIEEGASLAQRFKIYAGWAASLGEVNANGNTATLTGVDSGDQVTFVAGGCGEGFDSEFLEDSIARVHANSNTVTIASSTMYDVRGGCAAGGAYAEANGNTLTMTGGEAYEVHAGSASITNYGEADSKKIAHASGNTLSLQNTASVTAYGGYSVVENDDDDADITVSKKEAYAADNTVIVQGASYRHLMAGFAESDNIAEATGNMLYLNYDPEQGKNAETETVIKEVLYGGSAIGKTAKASGNTGKIVNAVFSEDAQFAGGYAYSSVTGGSAEASGNIFEAEGGTYSIVYGGQAQGDKTTANNNELTINNASIKAVTDGEREYLGLVYGGSAESISGDATADLNKLTFSGGTYSAEIFGGCASSTGGDAAANTNTVSLYGGTYNGSILGGLALTDTATSTAEASSNTVGLYALNGVSPAFSTSTVIFGGCAFQAGTEVASSSGNTLKFNNVKGMTAANIKNFQNLTFSYTEALAANDVVLTLKGTEADAEAGIVAEPATTIAAGGRISVSVTSLKGADSDTFAAGDRVYLLKNDNGLVLDEVALSLETATVKTGGGVLECRLELKKEGDSLYLTSTGGATAAPETKALSEGALAGLALAGESHEAVSQVLDNMSDQDVFTFGTVHASNKTYESGSSINVSSVSLIAGLGKGFATGAGHLSVGAFFEYGKGSYTTHNSFDDRADVSGDGTSWYMGGGILGKMNFRDTGPGHFYLEGSAHMGTVHNEYDSSDVAGSLGSVARLDMDSPYYSLHGGLGYVWNMAEGHELKVYGRYMWTMLQGTDETLTAKAKYDLDDMYSSRIRAGVRYSYTGSERFKPYVGAAYEHEFAGSCDARVYGYDVNSPSFEGGTGIGELGIAMVPRMHFRSRSTLACRELLARSAASPEASM